MAQPVTGWLGYDPASDRPLVKLVAGTKKLLTEDDSSGGGGGGGPHHLTHENGGSDEVNLTGLSGQLADVQVATINAGGPKFKAFTLRKVSTGTSVAEEIGVLRFNASAFPSHTFTLVAELEVSTAGQTATLQMVALQSGTVLATLTTTQLVTTKQTALLSLPAGEGLYDVRLSRTGGTANAFVSCRAAGLEVAHS